MRTEGPFAEVDKVQGSIRGAVTELAGTVSTIIGDGTTDLMQGLIERELDQTRKKIKALRLQERLLLDRAAASLESAARGNGQLLWVPVSESQRSGDPRRPDRVREAILGQLVKANTHTLLGDAPPAVLFHRLRRAAANGDQVTVEAIKEIAIRRLIHTGHVCDEREMSVDAPQERRYLMEEELGACYADYEQGLDAVLDATASVEEAWLRPEQRQARTFVRSGRHRREPVDLRVWASRNKLLSTVVARLGDV